VPSSETTPPRVEGRPDLSWMTADIYENHPGGMFVLKCLITENGLASECIVLKSLPGLEQKIVEAFRSSRFKPSVFQNKPVAVYWQFSICVATAAQKRGLR